MFRTTVSSAVMAAAFFVSAVSADDLTVFGKVADSEGAGIDGAVVMIQKGLNTEDTVSTTTDGNGDYEINTEYLAAEWGGGFVIVNVSADGYVGDQTYAIVNNTTDQEADTVELNFVLDSDDSEPLPVETITITGKVVDDETGEGIENALIIVTSGVSLAVQGAQ